MIHSEGFYTVLLLSDAMFGSLYLYYTISRSLIHINITWIEPTDWLINAKVYACLLSLWITIGLEVVYILQAYNFLTIVLLIII